MEGDEEEIERLVIGIRADTAGFARDVQEMKGLVDSSLVQGIGRAGSVLETGLRKAIQRGSLELEDLKRVALSVMNDIANAALRSGIASLFGSASSGAGLVGLGSALLGSLLGAPPRATGGQVTAHRAYKVGEQGPELFIPHMAGRIEPLAAPRSTQLQVTINLSDNGQGSAPDQLRRSSRQVARAVRQALAARAD